MVVQFVCIHAVMDSVEGRSDTYTDAWKSTLYCHYEPLFMNAHGQVVQLYNSAKEKMN